MPIKTMNIVIIVLLAITAILNLAVAIIAQRAAASANDADAKKLKASFGILMFTCFMLLGLALGVFFANKDCKIE